MTDTAIPHAAFSVSRRLLGPAVMTFVMLLVLLGLGSWQVKRLFWKEAILAEIDRAEAAAAIPLGPSPSPFTKVAATGVLLPDETALYGADVRDIASGPEMGARMIEPLRESNGDILLVDRGWVPLSRKSPIEQPEGTIAVSGYVRSGDSHHWFSATDDVAGRHFYTLDPKAIGDAIGQPNVRPFVLVALADGPESSSPVTRFPEPARHLPRPPNSHLSYAITWYGLAVALLAVFFVWARKESRA
jgi:surfeit locus 1 family protein